MKKQVVEKIFTLFDSTDILTTTQLPIYAQEFLQYKFTSACIITIVSILIIILLITLLLLLHKTKNNDSTLDVILVIIIFVLFIVFIYNVSTMIHIYTSPKIWLLKYIEGFK